MLPALELCLVKVVGAGALGSVGSKGDRWKNLHNITNNCTRSDATLLQTCQFIDSRRVQPLDKKMKRSHYILPILALVLTLALTPLPALANTASPLIWASQVHLFIGNAIIGLIEGLLLARLFKCSKRNSVVILIAANYLSAWAVAILVAGYLPSLVDITIQNIQIWFLIFVIVAFLVTYLIEYPVFFIALGGQQHRFRRSLMATLIVNGISYILLFSWYWVVSGASTYTALDVVSADRMKLPEPYVLYYISQGGDQVMRMDLNDTDSTQMIAKIMVPHPNDELFTRPRSDSGFDLFVYTESQNRFVYIDSENRGPEKGSRALEKAEVTLKYFGPVPAIGKQSDWKFSTLLHAGIKGENAKTGRHVHYFPGLLFTGWRVRNATQISEASVVAQVGDDQICLMNFKSRTIALIARGKRPVVTEAKKV